MLGKIFEKQRTKRIDNMLAQVSKLSDEELKEWYQGSEMERLSGQVCQQTKKLSNEIEEELERRGFVYMKDF